jgi:sugar lactone lactonase YvrE
MSTKFPVLPIGISVLALLTMSASLPASAQAQAPPFLLQWGSRGSGPGQFDGPAGVAVDASGDVYVADLGNGRVQKFTAAGVYITQFAGGRFALDVAVGLGGNVYVANGSTIQKFASSGALVAEWNAGTSGAFAIAVDAGSYVYAADVNYNRIQKFSDDGTLITQWGGFGTGDGQLNYPSGLAVDASGIVYVVDDNLRIQKFTSSGSFVANWGTLAQPYVPYRVAVDGTGNVYVTGSSSLAGVRMFTSANSLIAEWGSQGTGPGEFDGAGAVAVDAGGNVYVTDTHNYRVQKFGPVATPTRATSWGRLKRLYR